MAIAFDSADTTPNLVNPGTSLTYSFTVGTGDDRLLIVHVWHSVMGDISGVTYNSVSMTKLAEQADGGGSNYLDVWYLVAPATGANDVVVSKDTSGVMVSTCASYSGVDQTTPIPTSASDNSTATTAFSADITTTETNSWVYCSLRDNVGANLTEDAPEVERVANEGNGYGQHVLDSNGTVSVGAYNVSGTLSSAATHGWIIAELAEHVAVVNAVKSINGLSNV